MSGVNKVILIGNLGADPEMRYTPSGTAVANMRIATSEKWTDKQTGEVNEKTEWHRIVAWKKLAELCGEYLSKGRQIYVEGRLETRKWQNRDGQDVYTTEVIANQIQFLGGEGRRGAGAGGNSNGNGGGQRRPQQQQGGAQSGFDYGPPAGMSDDDVPF